jgi:hypothetical protein
MQAWVLQALFTSKSHSVWPLYLFHTPGTPAFETENISAGRQE